MFQFFRSRGFTCAEAVISSSSCLFIIFIVKRLHSWRRVDFSQGQGGHGFGRRRSNATPHNQIRGPTPRLRKSGTPTYLLGLSGSRPGPPPPPSSPTEKPQAVRQTSPRQQQVRDRESRYLRP